MEGDKDGGAIKESTNEYRKAYEKLKEAYDAIVCQLQEIEQDYEDLKKSSGETNDEPVADGVIDNALEGVTDCIGRLMIEEMNDLREFNIEMHEKLKELETFFLNDNESVSAEDDAKFWSLAEEIAKMQESEYGNKY